MVNDQSNTYLQWALKSLAIWKSPNLSNATKIIQLSGDKDKNFPIKLIKRPNYKIKNGNHIMLFKQTEKINKIILDELQNVV